ncbi:hypothetical protein MMC29_001800 [Sticta canariensis]|nr:hypothetical protein [Sticta canariensis]
MSPLSSDDSGYHLGRPSPNTLYSAQSPDFSARELYFAHTDHGPELSPAERVHDLSQPQPSPSEGEKTGFRFNTAPKTESAKRKRKHWCWWMGGVVAVVIIIVLAVALPVGLTRRQKKSSGTSNGALSAATTGAANGTGLALLQLGTSDNDYTWHLYYQHSSGEIRDIYLNNYEWVPAANTDVGLPASVRDGTPLAYTSYALDAVGYPTYHMFYIDASGILQEMVNANGKSNWSPGSLGNLNVKPSESPSVGLNACSNERFNGANVSINERVFELYYGDKDGLVHELIYSFGNESWTPQVSFPNTMASAGIACSTSNSSFSYVFLSNTNHQLELWWKDSNDTAANRAANTPKHPLGTWNKVQNPAPITIRPNSSISRIRISEMSNFVFFQDPSGNVKALQPQLSAENSTWGSLIDIGSAVAQPWSHLASGTMFQGNFSNVPNLTLAEYQAYLGFHVFLQVDGNNITEYVRNYHQGQWTSDVIPGL